MYAISLAYELTIEKPSSFIDILIDDDCSFLTPSFALLIRSCWF